jgi:hypothetical protein
MPRLSGVEIIRLVVRNLDDCRESFLQRFTAIQLLKIGIAHLACGWDFPPDQWEERQIQEALRGKIPRWDSDSKPLYD